MTKRMSLLVQNDDERERTTMIRVLLFVARFSYPFLIGYLLGTLNPRW